MSYEQHIRHWRNHRKDRFFQQCSGPVQESTSLTYPDSLEADSFQCILEKTGDMDFPIHIATTAGYWHLTTPSDFLGTQIINREELERFYHDFVL